ncbi:hypothetical protein BVRB_1g022810 [Beta vulgaris subsp. vulgaris]|uniref:Uncharacterized protein n=1 Tax=Beta vulgaris subsp. vulgaris TaxID=3555 RepID=A0A0J8BDZ9_BETVV|nr:uncharacterized protein LOC104905879 [Beta vulgaris subsp. vulgaris]KMS99554.1 hypothetical protein BVRB_1g022810 [Beta vulgaris subsp. vulgaris]
MEKKSKEKEGEIRQREDDKQKDYTYEYEHHQAPNISEMKSTTTNAYGGGMYALEKADERPSHPPASQTQSADGPAEAEHQPKHQPPPSSGDRDIDITGQSYIQ